MAETAAAKAQDGSGSSMSNSMQKTFIHGQKAVTTSAAALDSTPDRSCENGIRLIADPSNSAAIFIGNSSAVTTSTGFPLYAGREIVLPVPTSDLIFVIAASSQTLYYIGC